MNISTTQTSKLTDRPNASNLQDNDVLYMVTAQADGQGFRDKKVTVAELETRLFGNNPACVDPLDDDMIYIVTAADKKRTDISVATLTRSILGVRDDVNPITFTVEDGISIELNPTTTNGVTNKTGKRFEASIGEFTDFILGKSFVTNAAGLPDTDADNYVSFGTKNPNTRLKMSIAEFKDYIGQNFGNFLTLGVGGSVDQTTHELTLKPYFTVDEYGTTIFGKNYSLHGHDQITIQTSYVIDPDTGAVSSCIPNVSVNGDIFVNELVNTDEYYLEVHESSSMTQLNGIKSKKLSIGRIFKKVVGHHYYYEYLMRDSLVIDTDGTISFDPASDNIVASRAGCVGDDIEAWPSWNKTIQYSIGNCVLYTTGATTNVYACIVPCKNIDPVNDVNSSLYWIQYTTGNGYKINTTHPGNIAMYIELFYSAGEIVYYKGSLYRCLKTAQNKTPTDLGSTYWTLVGDCVTSNGNKNIIKLLNRIVTNTTIPVTTDSTISFTLNDISDLKSFSFNDRIFKSYADPTSDTRDTATNNEYLDTITINKPLRLMNSSDEFDGITISRLAAMKYTTADVTIGYPNFVMSTTVAVGDIVAYNGVLYIAKVAISAASNINTPDIYCRASTGAWGIYSTPDADRVIQLGFRSISRYGSVISNSKFKDTDINLLLDKNGVSTTLRLASETINIGLNDIYKYNRYNRFSFETDYTGSGRDYSRFVARNANVDVAWRPNSSKYGYNEFITTTVDPFDGVATRKLVVGSKTTMNGVYVSNFSREEYFTVNEDGSTYYDPEAINENLLSSGIPEWNHLSLYWGGSVVVYQGKIYHCPLDSWGYQPSGDDNPTLNFPAQWTFVGYYKTSGTSDVSNMVLHGNWSSTASYIVGDLVYYGPTQSWFTALVANTNTNPDLNSGGGSFGNTTGKWHRIGSVYNTLNNFNSNVISINIKSADTYTGLPNNNGVNSTNFADGVYYDTIDFKVIDFKIMKDLVDFMRIEAPDHHHKMLTIDPMNAQFTFTEDSNVIVNSAYSNSKNAFLRLVKREVVKGTRLGITYDSEIFKYIDINIDDFENFKTLSDILTLRSQTISSVTQDYISITPDAHTWNATDPGGGHHGGITNDDCIVLNVGRVHSTDGTTDSYDIPLTVRDFYNLDQLSKCTFVSSDSNISLTVNKLTVKDCVSFTQNNRVATNTAYSSNVSNTEDVIATVYRYKDASAPGYSYNYDSTFNITVEDMWTVSHIRKFLNVNSNDVNNSHDQYILNADYAYLFPTSGVDASVSTFDNINYVALRVLHQSNLSGDAISFTVGDFKTLKSMINDGYDPTNSKFTGTIAAGSGSAGIVAQTFNISTIVDNYAEPAQSIVLGKEDGTTGQLFLTAAVFQTTPAIIIKCRNKSSVATHTSYGLSYGQLAYLALNTPSI